MGSISRPMVVLLMLIAAFVAGPVAAVYAGPHTVNLIPLIDLDKDVVSGKWKLDHGAIVSDSTHWARLRIPYEPPEEYDFHIEFVRTSGDGDIGQMFRYLGHSCMWQMAGWNNTVCGFTTINGVDANNANNPTSVRGQGLLQSGHKYSSVVHVRRGSVEAWLDGKVMSKCSLDPSKYGTLRECWIGADGLGIGAVRGPTIFSVIEVVEISGPGKRSPRNKSDNDKPDDNRPDEKKPDEPASVTELHADNPADSTSMAGPTTRICTPQSSINALEIFETDSGMMLGQTSEVTLTVTRSETSKAVSVRFVTKIGDEMALARDEALRFIRVTNPNWYADGAELTFEDKYTGHDGGSIGAAIGTLILSTIQGIAIDPDATITGDISANGKVRAIGGVSAKIRGATASKCKIVAIPTDNYDQLVDTLVYSGPAAVTDVQIIGISNLDDAVAVMRTYREANLRQAIDQFTEIQKSIAASPEFLHGKEAKGKLQQVLDLAPNHLSAKLLMMIAEGNVPKTLSPTASMYYTFVAVRTMLPILKERAQSDEVHNVPSSAVKDGLIALKKLRPLADESVRPLIDAWTRFIGAWSSFQSGGGSKARLQTQAQGVDDAMEKLRADQDLMQKMLKEGI